VNELKGKSYVMISHKGKKVSGNLGELLEVGYQQIEKRRGEWEKRCKRISKNGINKSKHNNKQIYFFSCFFVFNRLYFIYVWLLYLYTAVVVICIGCESLRLYNTNP
jgi:hypothetical protein